MPNGLVRIRLDTEAIVIGYAMSRLDDRYLGITGSRTWRDAFATAAAALSVRSASLKNLRDEFDPFHPNRRKGWHGRPLRKNRQRVLDELNDLSDAALAELVMRIIRRDEDAIVEAIDSLANITRPTHNVAERLLTGRKAEEYFLSHSETIVDVAFPELMDFRLLARGFDFGVRDQPALAIEVKGLKASLGPILFTDREWTEAACRGEDYWLVVVGNLESQPQSRLIRDPFASLRVRSQCRTSVAVVWQSTVRVA